MRVIMERMMAYASLGRVSNLPTVVSNVCAGAAVATGPVDPLRVAAAALSGMLLYVGGMAMNDVIDARVDRRKARHRPIPSGTISKQHAIACVIVCLIAGIGLATAIGGKGVAWALVGAIVLYNLLHSRFGWSVVFMGACRGLLYPLGAVAVMGWPRVIDTVFVRDGVVAVAIAATVYVLGFTLIARAEHTAGRSRWAWAGWLLPLCAWAPAKWVGSGGGYELALISAAVASGWLFFGAWLGWKGKTGHAVLVWIVGLCAMDALWIAAADGFGGLWAVAVSCGICTLVGHRVVKGT